LPHGQLYWRLHPTFVKGTGWLIQCNQVRLEAKNNEFFLPCKAVA
jgi:hypothetical protein